MENLGKPKLMKMFIIWGAVLSCVHVRDLRVSPCPPPGLRASLELTPPPREFLLGARAAWEPWGPHGTQLARAGGKEGHAQPRPQAPGPAGPAQGLKVPELTLRGQCIRGRPGGQGCQGRALQYPPSEANQLHPAALPGQLDQARDGNQGWPQPSHPKAPAQAPGSSWEGSPSGWMGPGQGCVWAGGQAWSKLSWKPSPRSARSTRLPGHAPHGPRGTVLQHALSWPWAPAREHRQGPDSRIPVQGVTYYWMDILYQKLWQYNRTRLLLQSLSDWWKKKEKKKTLPRDC